MPNHLMISGEERVGRSLAVHRTALAVERPAEYGRLGKMFAEPLIDQRGLSRPARSNDLDRIRRRVGPGAVKKRRLLFATDQGRVYTRAAWT